MAGNITTLIQALGYAVGIGAFLAALYAMYLGWKRGEGNAPDPVGLIVILCISAFALGITEIVVAVLS